MELMQLMEYVHEMSLEYPASIVVRHHDQICVAGKGNVSTTAVAPAESWRIRTAANTAVWEMQNPTKTFEAITTAISIVSST
jgi:hypothetical protein